MAIVALTQMSATRGFGAAVTNVSNGSLSVSDTYTLRNDGKTMVKAVKTGAGACTITAVTPATVRGGAVADPTYTVPATTGDVWIGPFETDVFNDSNGLVTISLSEITGLSLSVISVS